MADTAKLEAAFYKADAAGDTAAAKVLADEIRRVRAAAPQTTQAKVTPSGEKSTPATAIAEEALPLLRGFAMGGVTGLAGAGVNKSMEAVGKLLERGAYEAGGAVTDVTGSPVAGAVANAATQAIPMVLGGGAGRAVEPVMRGAARSLMQSSLKPSAKDLTTGRAKQAVETMLSEGANVSESGVAKLQGRANDLQRQINEQLALANEYGPTVSRDAVAGRAQDAINKFSKQVDPTADVAAITGTAERFQAANPAQIAAQRAQELKQGTYSVLRGKYGEQGSASVEAQKALARGLREEIERIAPEVKVLNAEESKIINALVMADRRARLEGNKNPVGLGLLANNMNAGAAFLGDRSAAFKSALARLLNARAKDVPTATGVAVGATVGGGAEE